MFCIPFFNCSSYCKFSTLVFLTCFASGFSDNFSYSKSFSASAACNEDIEIKWIERYLKTVDETVSLEELLDFLVAVRTHFIAKGYEMPSLSSLCVNTFGYLEQEGLALSEDYKDLFFEMILEKENQSDSKIETCNLLNPKPMYMFVKSKKKEGKRPGIEVPPDIIIGGLKILIGAVCCCVPHPATIAIGGSVVASGLHDVGNGLKETDRQAKEISKEYGPPPVPPHFPEDFFDKQKSEKSN